jgi:hypothetical protein
LDSASLRFAFPSEQFQNIYIVFMGNNYIKVSAIGVPGITVIFVDHITSAVQKGDKTEVDLTNGATIAINHTIDQFEKLIREA